MRTQTDADLVVRALVRYNAMLQDVYKYLDVDLTEIDGWSWTGQGDAAGKEGMIKRCRVSVRLAVLSQSRDDKMSTRQVFFSPVSINLKRKGQLVVRQPIQGLSQMEG